MQKMLPSNIFQGSKTTVLQMAFISQKNVWTNCLQYFKWYLVMDLLTLGWECCTHAKQGCWKLSFQRLELPEAALESGGGTLGWCFRPCSCWARIQITRADRLCGNVKSISIRISSTRQIGADRHWMCSRHWPLSQLLQNREHLKLAFSQPEGKPMGKGTFKYILSEFRLNRDTFRFSKFN